MVIDAAGGEHGRAAVPTPFAAGPEGTEMSVADLERALQAVIGRLGESREAVIAVGVAGMAESGAPLLGSRPVAPIIAWHDGRGEETVASLEARFGADLPLRTGRRLRTVSSVAKLGWLLDHGVPVPDRWLGVPELALWLLTDAEATEHSLAARTGAYDVSERRWLADVLRHLGVRQDAVPEVRRAGTPMGSVSPDAARRFGVPSGIPVTIAGHDHLAAAAGLGARPDDLLNSVGTAETLLRRVDSRPDVRQALELDLAVTVWPGGDGWCLLASATRSGLVIDALAAHLGVEPAALDDLARSAEEEGTGRSTLDLGQGIAVPVGSPAAMWAEARHSLVQRTAAAAERVARVTGPHRRLVVFGGGSRSRSWLAAKEAALGIPVVSCPVPEATARGAALAAGVAAGWWSSPADGAPPLSNPPTGRGDNEVAMTVPIEPELSEEVAARTSGLRTGWTTGTCASAAAKAAAIGLCRGVRPDTVEVGLPDGQRVTFAVETGPSGGAWEAVVVKDAGDDPDCTDGARMTASVAFADRPAGEASEHDLRAGDGIGTVTLPGLGLPVGAPAINPVPRRMINAALAEVTDRPLVVTFSVPGGQAMAAKTTNERLGIVGGISILGTTGVVKPFSTASYRASVVQQIDVAAAQGHDMVVLATGSRSEAYALQTWPEVPSVCVVEVGDFTGIALRHAAGAGMRQAVFVGMVGKITKLAAGVMMTHFHRSKVDTDLLADVARASGAPPKVVAAATETATARHFFEVCVAEGVLEPLAELCRRAAANCRTFVDGALDVDVHLVDFEGRQEVASSALQ